MEELTKHPGWPVLVDWLNERMKPVKLAVLNGAPKNFEDYLTKANWLKGITDAIEAPKTIVGLLDSEQVRRREK